MNRIMAGQILMVLCCMVYLVWWYRGYRPGTHVSRIGGINGILLLITAGLGVAGIMMSMTSVPASSEMKVDPGVIIVRGIISYIVLLLVTRFCFQRIVTAELLLIVAWTVVEAVVITRLDAAGYMGRYGFFVMCIVLALAFAVSIVLYVAYYRMEEMKAFYAAMVPLVTEAVSMVILIVIMLSGNLAP